jgi:hypothetical protein
MFRGFRHEKSQYSGTFESVRNCGTFFADIPCVYRKNFFGEDSPDGFQKKSFSYKENAIFVPHVPHHLKMA